MGIMDYMANSIGMKQNIVLPATVQAINSSLGRNRSCEIDHLKCALRYQENSIHPFIAQLKLSD
ncbi:hypothetical protein RhiirB3_405658 [Rhizophagus irregularis]|nr:hypothetical protein RhiirB3_405658 [Rhizophagus irregularis]